MRQPDERSDAELEQWYRRLLDVVGAGQVRAGTWQLLEPCGWSDNTSYRRLLAWSSSGAGDAARHIIVVNLSDAPADGQIPLDWPELPATTWHLRDLLSDVTYQCDGSQLRDPGLDGALQPGQTHLLALS